MAIGLWQNRCWACNRSRVQFPAFLVQGSPVEGDAKNCTLMTAGANLSRPDGPKVGFRIPQLHMLSNLNLLNFGTRLFYATLVVHFTILPACFIRAIRTERAHGDTGRNCPSLWTCFCCKRFVILLVAFLFPLSQQVETVLDWRRPNVFLQVHNTVNLCLGKSDP